jgi:hypothetical protein
MEDFGYNPFGMTILRAEAFCKILILKIFVKCYIGGYPPPIVLNR